MIKDKIFILSVINMIFVFIFKNAVQLNIGGYDVYRISYILPLYYNYLIIPFITLLLLFINGCKLIKNNFTKKSFVLIVMNIIIGLLIISDKNSLIWN
jgi:hypothetical protein